VYTNEFEIEKVLSKIDREELIKLTLHLGNIYSPAGYEKEACEFLYKWLKENEFEVEKQEFANARYNIIGKLKGEGDGVNLMFNSHIDNWLWAPEDWLITGEDEGPEFNKAWIENDEIFGQSVVNDKGPMAASLIAAKAIKKASVKLRGGLILALVSGEISRAEIDEYQGDLYKGKGIGTYHLLMQGVIPDYAIVAEATDRGLTWVEAGDMWFKITVKGGRPTYTPFVKHTLEFDKNTNAILRAIPIIEAIEKWAMEYEEKNKYEFEGGVLIPKVSINAIRGGRPCCPASTSRVCYIYVDVRLSPTQSPREVEEELRKIIADLGINAEIKVYLYRKGIDGKNVSPLVEVIDRVQTQVIGTKLQKVRSPITSMWRDVNILNGFGIPAVTYAPIMSHPPGDADVPFIRAYRVKIDDLINTAKIYALVALEICRMKRQSP
jgi:acetylornithine deacetylase/succinyl-diaminopimelate desuccinylase-like protein